ncbi:MAG: IS200/IS605 family transposase [Pyrinomonadaceae bacterium]
MSSTHLSLHYHLVFSTKGRIAFIHKDWRDRLHCYLGGIVRDLGGIPESIGGTEDHVHMLVGLRATHCLASVMKEIKGSSSKWVHQEIKMPKFLWQEGYGAFTISAIQIESVRRYIMRQEEHHQRKTFQDEYVEFLKLSGVKYPAQHLW